MSEKIDPEMQRLQTIHIFFTGAGWKLFSEMLGEMIFLEECKQNKMCQEAINDNRLQELNFCLGKKKAYQTVLALKEELLGEQEQENSPEKQA